MSGTVMSKSLQKSKRHWITFSCLVILLGTSLIIIWSPRGLLHLRDLHQEYHELIEKNQTIQENNHRLYQEITRLRKDPDSIEHLARKELGLVREDELIIYFTPPDQNKNNNSK